MNLTEEARGRAMNSEGQTPERNVVDTTHLLPITERYVELFGHRRYRSLPCRLLTIGGRPSRNGWLFSSLLTLVFLAAIATGLLNKAPFQVILVMALLFFCIMLCAFGHIYWLVRVQALWSSMSEIVIERDDGQVERSSGYWLSFLPTIGWPLLFLMLFIGSFYLDFQRYHDHFRSVHVSSSFYVLLGLGGATVGWAFSTVMAILFVALLHEPSKIRLNAYALHAANLVSRGIFRCAMYFNFVFAIYLLAYCIMIPAAERGESYLAVLIMFFGIVLIIFTIAPQYKIFTLFREAQESLILRTLPSFQRDDYRTNPTNLREVMLMQHYYNLTDRLRFHVTAKITAFLSIFGVPLFVFFSHGLFTLWGELTSWIS